MNITITFVSYEYLLAQVLAAALLASVFALACGLSFLYHRKRFAKKKAHEL